MKLLKADWLIDGLGNPPVRHPSVLVGDGRIEAVATGAAGDAVSADETLEFLGATILPGLIDAHVHVTLDPSCYSASEFLASTTDDGLYAVGMRQLQGSLPAGVTTVRDLGARGGVALRLRDEPWKTSTAGARMLAAGPALTTPAGHGHFLGVEVADVAQLRAVSLQLVADGVDLIKVMATGGGVTPGSDPLRPQFDAAALRVVTDIAHAAGLKVAAHAHSREGIMNCLDAGVDSIEHCTFVAPHGVEPDVWLIDRLAEGGVCVVPTLAPWYVLRDSDDPYLGFPQFGLSPRVMCDQVLALVARMRQSGVRLVAGTDAGTFRLTPDRLHDELAAFVLAGFTPAEAVYAATGLAATALGRAEQVGSVEVGKRADLIVVPGNLAEGLSGLSSPLLVMKDGEVCWPPRLDPEPVRDVERRYTASVCLGKARNREGEGHS